MWKQARAWRAARVKSRLVWNVKMVRPTVTVAQIIAACREWRMENGRGDKRESKESVWVTCDHMHERATYDAGPSQRAVAGHVLRGGKG